MLASICSFEDKYFSVNISCSRSPHEDLFLFIFCFFGGDGGRQVHPHFLVLYFVCIFRCVRRVDRRPTPDLPSSIREGFEVLEELSSHSRPHPWDRDFRGHKDGMLERRGGWRRFQKRILLILPPPAAPKQRSDPEQESHF